jgi:hypothetical protein
MCSPSVPRLPLCQSCLFFSEVLFSSCLSVISLLFPRHGSDEQKMKRKRTAKKRKHVCAQGGVEMVKGKAAADKIVCFMLVWAAVNLSFSFRTPSTASTNPNFLPQVCNRWNELTQQRDVLETRARSFISGQS